MNLRALALLPLAFLVTGCSLNSGNTSSPTQGTAFGGSIHGGRQPIAGAHIYLLAAATTAYGDPSVSLLNLSATGRADFLGAYVTSNADGAFSISSDYTCTPNTQVYLYSQGGDPGAGPNDAAGLLAVLGNCPVDGNFAAATPFVAMNEVTTVAAAYAFAGYATDATHVASSGTPLALTGIANAFANASNIADLASGAALATTPAGNGAAPQSTTNALANILAACVNSTGPGSITCSTLLGNATSDGTLSGATPIDTANAAINIAHNPAANVADLFNLIPTTAPFVPSLVAQPADYSLALNFTGGGITASQSLAIDSLGNVWAADTNSALLKYSSLGVPLSGPTGFTNASLNNPSGIAIDRSSNIWLSNAGSGTTPLAQFDSFGNFITAPSGSLTDSFYTLTISPTGDLLVPSLHNGVGLYDFSSTGVYKGLYATPHLVEGLAVQSDGTIGILERRSRCPQRTIQHRSPSLRSRLRLRHPQPRPPNRRAIRQHLDTQQQRRHRRRRQHRSPSLHRQRSIGSLPSRTRRSGPRLGHLHLNHPHHHPSGPSPLKLRHSTPRQLRLHQLHQPVQRPSDRRLRQRLALNRQSPHRTSRRSRPGRNPSHQRRSQQHPRHPSLTKSGRRKSPSATRTYQHPATNNHHPPLSSRLRL